jgi:hypothetical protein
LAVAGFQNTLDGSAALTQGSNSIRLGTSTGQANEIISKIITVGAGGTNALVLNNTLPDLCNQTSTVTKILGIMVTLLPSSDSSGLGTDCTSITLGANGANPWVAVLNNTGTYTLLNGATWAHWYSPGLSVGGTDVLKILNNDGGHSAGVQLSIVCQG